MTNEDWKKYGKYLTTATTCPVCCKPITAHEKGVTYSKTRRGTHVFAHDKCLGIKGGSDG